jgi:uncharacterized protein YdiU (UPF0061 family)
MVHWMRVGFVHGVMNTDNMSILGLTIDYGPYGWLEDYDLNWTPNTTDAEMRRYTFGQQPRIGLWNLAQLANALWPLIEDKNILEKGLETYQEVYNGGWQQMMAAKLGLVDYRHESDASLLADLVKILQLTETDMTLFFRELANVQAQWVTPSVADGDTDASVADTHSLELGPLGRLPAPLTTAYYDPKQVAEKVVVQIEDWLRAYGRRLQTDSQTAEDRKRKMDQVNPRFVLRNYLAQLAIDAAEQGDYALIHELQRVLANPYHEQPESQHLADKRPDWARNRAGCSMLSCSS